MVEKLRPDELASFREAFDTFDKNSDGTISTKELHAAMRRAGQNPTESEVQDMINTVDVDGSGFVEFPEFCNLMYKKISDADTENELKETFRVFSKDNEGCITAEELKFVLTHLPGKVTYKEIDEMIKTVDKNGDGKINYSEFRVMMGAPPLLIPATTLSKFARSATALTNLTNAALFGGSIHQTTNNNNSNINLEKY